MIASICRYTTMFITGLTQSDYRMLQRKEKNASAEAIVSSVTGRDTAITILLSPNPNRFAAAAAQNFSLIFWGSALYMPFEITTLHICDVPSATVNSCESRSMRSTSE